MQRFYRRRIAEWWRTTAGWSAEMSTRELQALINALPVDSAYARAVRGHAWNDTEFLLADISDLVQLHRAEFLRANGAKSSPRFRPAGRPSSTDEADQRERAEAMRRAHDHITSRVLTE